MTADTCPACGFDPDDPWVETVVYCGDCGAEHVRWDTTPIELAGSTFECVGCGADNVVPTPGVGR